MRQLAGHLTDLDCQPLLQPDVALRSRGTEHITFRYADPGQNEQLRTVDHNFPAALQDSRDALAQTVGQARAGNAQQDPQELDQQVQGARMAVKASQRISRGRFANTRNGVARQRQRRRYLLQDNELNQSKSSQCLDCQWRPVLIQPSGRPHSHRHPSGATAEQSWQNLRSSNAHASSMAS